MITEFSIDQAFFSSRALNDESLSAVHDFITNSWLNFGVMVLPRGSGQCVLAMIEKLPNKFRQRWVQAFEYGRIFEVDRQWWEFDRYESFESLCELNELFRTAFSEDAISYVLCGNDNYKKTCQTTGFEMLGAGICSESLHLAKCAELATSDIIETQTADQIWNTRFDRLARHSKNITIMDRYFFENIWRAAQKNLSDEGMKNFFTFITRYNKKFNIKIISHGNIKDSDFHTAIYNKFYTSIYKSPIYQKSLNSLTLISASDDFFRDQCHDRFIGFDKHICQIGNGMRILGNSPIPRSTFLAKFDRDAELAKREASSRSRKYKLWEEQF